MHCSLEEGDAFLLSKDIYDKTSMVLLGRKTLKKQKNHLYEKNEWKLAFIKPWKSIPVFAYEASCSALPLSYYWQIFNH